MKKVLSVVVGVVLVVLGAMIPPAVTLVTFILPPIYRATASIALPAAQPPAVATEMARIQSAAVLDQVVTELNLRSEWAQKFKLPDSLTVEKARSMLKAGLAVRQSKDAGLICIDVLSDNAAEAATIANKVASAYREAAGKSPVQIVGRAEANAKPFRPNKPFNIFMGCAAGAVFAIVGIVLIVWSRKISKVRQPHEGNPAALPVK